jgi:hypothetical protein
LNELLKSVPFTLHGLQLSRCAIIDYCFDFIRPIPLTMRESDYRSRAIPYAERKWFKFFSDW